MHRRIRQMILVLVSVSCAGLFFYSQFLKAQYATLYLKNANYIVQIGMYEIYKTEHSDVVMLGNSLTYNANWNELLGRTNITNRGIPNDIVPGYLHRLQYLYKLSPKICFIEGGVNDVYANYSADEVFSHYKILIDSLKAHGIIPIIQTTMFVARSHAEAEKHNNEIQKLNILLTKYAKENSMNILDINSLVSKDNFLCDELTYDGLHLNAKGYARWVPEVNKALLSYSL